MNKGKWFVLFTEDCVMKYETFSKRETLNAFLTMFLLQNQENDDSVIYMIGKGDIEYNLYKEK